MSFVCSCRNKNQSKAIIRKKHPDIHLVHAELVWNRYFLVWKQAHFQKYFVSHRKKLFHTIWNVVCILLAVSHCDTHTMMCVSHHTRWITPSSVFTTILLYSHQKSMFYTTLDDSHHPVCFTPYLCIHTQRVVLFTPKQYCLPQTMKVHTIYVTDSYQKQVYSHRKRIIHRAW